MVPPASQYCESPSTSYGSETVFELQILVGNVVAPAAMLLLTWLACAALPDPHRSRLTPLALAASSSVAIWIALAARNGFAGWPEDAWQKIPIAALIVSAAAIIAALLRSPTLTADPISEAKHSVQAHPLASPKAHRTSSSSSIVQWIAIAAAALSAAWLIFPRGDAWAELQNDQAQWCLVIALSTSLAWWGIAGCRPAVSSAVGLATIPLLIASAFLTSLSIMKITEPLIAVATVIGLCSLIDLRLTGHKSLPIMLAPALFAMASFIAHANFQSYLGLPRTLYFLAMLSPALVALAARISQRKSTRVAIAATFCMALLLAATMAAWTYVAGDVGAEPEW